MLGVRFRSLMIFLREALMLVLDGPQRGGKVRMAKAFGRRGLEEAVSERSAMGREI